MRDPQGVLTLEGDRAVRHLRQPVPAGHFLYSPAAGALVRDGLLLPYEWLDSNTLASPRIPFVSQPTEWCDSQFFDAARLTLDIAERAGAQDHELKDASAWNLIFVGGRPVFCDHLSFEPAAGRLWWAGGQLARHFIVPLWISARRGLQAHRCFQAWRDGVPPEVARRMLGPSRFLSRCWPLVAGGAGAAPAQAVRFDTADRRFRARLLASLRWMLDGVAPRSTGGRSTWSAYVDQRPQYPGASLAQKAATVSGWLERLRPHRVLDLGCNTGEFSALALGGGAEVVAIDADHESVERLYRRHRGQTGLVAVVAPLDDLSGGRGWNGAEHPGLPQRLAGGFDLALLLALVHHLTIAASIPIEAVAAVVGNWARRWLVVESLETDDPQVQLLCAQHRRDAAEFGPQRLLSAFGSAGWRLVERVDLAPARRSLLLLTKGA